VAEILVAAGANVNELNYNNFSPLHCAVSSVSMSLCLFPRFVMYWRLAFCSINAVCSFFTRFIATVHPIGSFKLQGTAFYFCVSVY
jgi:hypothetical protein